MLVIKEVLDIDRLHLYGIDEAAENIVYFDIETTGFSPLSTQLYLIGAIGFEDNHYVLTQWFAECKADEPQLLCSFFSYLKNKKILVHFNGSGFDIPYMIKRCQLLHIPCDFGGITSIDLYKILVPLKGILKLENLKQKTIEQFLEIPREDTKNGGELIAVYQEYLLTKGDELYRLLMLHNHDDVIGMLDLLPMLYYTSLQDDHYNINSITYQDRETNTNNGNREVIVDISLPNPLPRRISFGNAHYYCVANQDTLKISIQATLGELKHFYPNYKDYYYLPAEDKALHKSVAQFAEKSFREKAKPSICYCRQSGLFLPQYEELMSPVFRKNHNDSISYFEIKPEPASADSTLSLVSVTDELQEYIHHILHTLIKSAK